MNSVESNGMAARLKELFLVFFKISAFTFGGGLAMLPLISREFVEERGWITCEDMVDTIAVVQSMPGIMAVNMGVMVGYKVAGIPGVIAGSVGVVLPPFVVIIIVGIFLKSLTQYEAMNHIFLGIRSAVCALILVSVIKLSRQIIKGTFSLIVALLGFTLLVFLNVNAIWLIVCAGFAGLLYSLLIYKNADKQKLRKDNPDDLD